MKNKDVIKGALALGVMLIAIMYFAQPFSSTLDQDGDDSVACTMDAKQCSDGSYVGRVAPFCEFAECPPLNSPAEERNMLTDVTVIKYTKYGFSPKNITVKAGTKIGFQNTSNIEFWPKSELFDSEAGIAPGNKYIYSFDTPGTWVYYNNLNTADTGTIVVK
ncbi:MAG: cupredoxin domain-containing protein [Candidatus Pacebacteria bacterium]|jgi:plastocyanin|nr:cupredoxin domain-containing protein [Candidatus Paceibacterota bacterium]